MTALRHVLELLKLTLPFPLSMPHGLVCHLPDEAFFELEEAPSFRDCLFTSIQADQQEIGQHRQGYRAAHAFGLLGYLHLPQMETALQLLYRQLHPPTPGVHAENRPRARLGEIGHENFDALRPIVTPFLGQDNRDIAQIMERRAPEKDPVVT